VWEYGFPIVKRINHSYQVSHYFPQGTDATVYPPNVDMQFLNDSPGALLMQTHKEGDLAYFIYYGTDDGRRTNVLGPFLWGSSAPPPDRTEYTATDLKPGERKKMGERVPGVKALWYRYVRRTGTGETVESVFSNYEARPLYYLVGVASMPATGTGGSAQPTLFMEDSLTPPASGQ
jgi:vancomycin resistance protein YoaR